MEASADRIDVAMREGSLNGLTTVALGNAARDAACGGPAYALTGQAAISPLPMAGWLSAVSRWANALSVGSP